MLWVHWVFKVTLWAVFYEQVLAHGLFPVLHVCGTLGKHPFLVQRQCTASGAWSSHSGQGDASLAHVSSWYQLEFAGEPQACQNPAGFKTLQ